MSALQLLGVVSVFALARFALALRPSAPSHAVQGVQRLRGSLDALIAGGLAILFLATFVLRTYSIPSVSMSPTLRVGDVLLVNQFEYRMHAPQRGDIAVFRPPFASDGEFIKRVVAVPGDKLRLRDGFIYVNGKRSSEPYAPQRADYDLAVRDYGIYVNGDLLAPNRAQIPPRKRWQAADRIPAGFYFVVGDNLSNSDDSHIWGFASQAEFDGRAFLTVWPFDRMHILR